MVCRLPSCPDILVRRQDSQAELKYKEHKRCNELILDCCKQASRKIKDLRA